MDGKEDIKDLRKRLVDISTQIKDIDFQLSDKFMYNKVSDYDQWKERAKTKLRKLNLEKTEITFKIKQIFDDKKHHQDPVELLPQLVESMLNELVMLRAKVVDYEARFDIGK